MRHLLLLAALVPLSAQDFQFWATYVGTDTDLGFSAIYQQYAKNTSIGNPMIDVVADGNFQAPVLAMRSFGSPPQGGYIGGYSARGTKASPSAVQDGDLISNFRATAYNSSSFVDTAAIQMYANGTWTTSSQPSYISFSTTATGSNVMTERARIAANGKVGVEGQTAPDAILSFGATTGDKIAIYDPSATAQFGLGVQTGQFLVYAPSGNHMILGAGGTSSSVTNYFDINLSTGYITMPQNLIAGYTSTDLDSGSNGEIFAKRIAVISAASDAAFLQLLTNTGAGVHVISSNVTGAGTLQGVAFTMGAIEAMRIDTSGALLVGTTSPTDKFVVNGIINALSGYKANGTSGLSVTTTVRNSAGTGTCTLIYTFGLRTGGSC